MATEDILRLKYTEGQFLSAADFTAEQLYMDESRRRHYISEHTWGIVAGLTIEQNKPSNIWVVKAGMAIDAYGREVYVFEDEPLDTTEIASQLAGQTTATLQIWIAYFTETTAPAADGYAVCSTGAADTRIRESFQLLYQDQPPPFDTQDPEDRTKWPVAWQDLPDDPSAQPWPLRLGTITWTNGAIVSVDPKDRHYAGLTGIEVWSQTAQFDFHASTVRIRVEGAADAIITTNKATSATATSDLHIRTNDASGGNNVLIDKDNLHVFQDLTVDQKIVVKSTVGNGAGKLYVEPATSQDLATLTRPPNTGASPSHDLEISTNDGSGGNRILLEKDAVSMQSLTIAGATVVKGGMELWGGSLLLKQADGSDDTDPMALSRFNNGPDRNDLRIQIGDNIGGDDRFVVGPVYVGDGQFKEQFIVDNQGNVKTKGTVNGRDMAADAAKLNGISPNAKEVVAVTGDIFDGNSVTPPAGYTAAQCTLFVSPKIIPCPGAGALVCYAQGLTVVAQYTFPNNLPPPISGWASYLIIGIK